MNTDQDLQVLIIGAGITGLILAQGLKKAGIPYRIFERDTSLNVRSNEWTMAIHWSLERLEDILPAEIYEAMARASCNPDIPIEAGGKYPIIHGESGTLLAGVPYAKGLRVPRSKMRSLCGEGIVVEYGKRLISIEKSELDSVTAVFADGERVTGSIVIGADGTRSKVRELAIGSLDESSVSKYPIWHMNMTVCYGDADRARYLRKEFPTSYLALSDRSFHAFQSISSMPDGPEHPETWVFHLAMAWLGESNHELSNAERIAIIKEKAASLAEPARSAFSWIPEDTAVQRAEISYWIPRPWDQERHWKGSMTLVGDAAHPMPPYRGQGLNHCICDVSNLLKAIEDVHAGKKAKQDAITEYEDEIITRGREEVKCSMKNAEMLHDWEKVKQSPVFKDGFRPMKGHDSYDNRVEC